MTNNDNNKDNRQKKYRKFKWATHLNLDDSLKASDLQRFLWNQGILPANSRYALVKYVLEWAYLEMVNNFPNYDEIINKVEDIN